MGTNERHGMQIVQCEVGRMTILALRGSLRGSSCRVLAQAVERVVNAGARQVVLDLGEVAAIDAEGVGALVGQHARSAARGATLRLVRAHGPVRQLLELARIDEVIETSAVDLLLDRGCERCRRSA
jgi:anti-sigma B factor antagonist